MITKATAARIVAVYDDLEKAGDLLNQIRLIIRPDTAEGLTDTLNDCTDIIGEFIKDRQIELVHLDMKAQKEMKMKPMVTTRITPEMVRKATLHNEASADDFDFKTERKADQLQADADAAEAEVDEVENVFADDEGTQGAVSDATVDAITRSIIEGATVKVSDIEVDQRG